MVKSRFANEVKDSPDSTPDLIKYVEQNQIVGFDGVEDPCSQSNQHQRSAKVFASPPALEINTVASENCIDEQFPNHQRKHSVSISMPSSPVRDKSEFFADNDEFKKGFPNQLESNAYTPEPKRVKFLSQPMPKGVVLEEGMNSMNFPTDPKFRKFRDKRYDSFKTWSGRLERQITHLRGGLTEDPSPDDDDDGQRSSRESIPVHRFFDALEGPELDALRPSEEILLPEDKTWPFLLRYPISSFGICLGVSSQAILWKAMATSESTKFLHISLKVNLVLWFISLALVAVVASTYLLKIIFYFEAVRREYYHPIRVNFFFAPWIALLFIAIGLPPSIAETLPQALWYVLMTPFLCLELKIYGQWMSGGQRRLSKVANPSNHLSIVGNFVGALLGASLGLKEGPIFFFAIGLAHYTVLFVTLYQRLPTNETLPKELHPVFFLFVAAPSVASMAWARIHGSFDFGSKIAYFIALFLYFSLAVRVNFFRGFTFSLSWWAYTFPMTGAAIATIRYANVVDTVVTKALVLILSAIATLVVTALLVTTIIHAFVLRKLFPNDISIAISDRKPKHHHRTWFHKRNGSAEPSDIENYLKYSTSEGDDSKGLPK